MARTRPLPIALIGGAFKNPEYLWPESRERHNARVVGDSFDLATGIHRKASMVLNEIASLGSPVFVCGHSLGALVAYEVARMAPTDLILGTALVCPPMIGGTYHSIDVSAAMEMVTNPFGLMRQLLQILPERPESMFSLMTAVAGTIAINEEAHNLLVVGGDSDVVTPLSQVREVAKRTGGTLMEVQGGHNLPMNDPTGQLLGEIASHLRTRA